MVAFAIPDFSFPYSPSRFDGGLFDHDNERR